MIEDWEWLLDDETFLFQQCRKLQCDGYLALKDDVLARMDPHEEVRKIAKHNPSVRADPDGLLVTVREVMSNNINNPAAMVYKGHALGLLDQKHPDLDSARVVMVQTSTMNASAYRLPSGAYAVAMYEEGA